VRDSRVWVNYTLNGYEDPKNRHHVELSHMFHGNHGVRRFGTLASRSPPLHSDDWRAFSQTIDRAVLVGLSFPSSEGVGTQGRNRIEAPMESIDS